MKVTDILTQLKALADEKLAKQNVKRGAPAEHQFGVKLGDVRNIAAKIKSDHSLALQLWETENIEARQLACLIIEPKKLSRSEITHLAKTINFSWLADWFNSYVLKEYPEKELVREEWMNDANVWAARSGWSLTAGRISKNAEGINIPDLLNRLENEMGSAAPEVQWTMNTTLAQIGIHFPEFRARAIEIAEKLGVYRDYPVSKGCTSPFAPIWIDAMVNRKK